MGVRDDENRGYRDLVDKRRRPDQERESVTSESREQPETSRAVSPPPLPAPPDPALAPPPRPRQVWWRLVARLFLLFVNLTAAAGGVLGALSLVARTGNLGVLPAVNLVAALAGGFGLGGFAKSDAALRAKLLLASGVLWSVVGAVSVLRVDKHVLFDVLNCAAATAITLDARAAVVRGETRLVPLTARSYLVIGLLWVIGGAALGAYSKHKKSQGTHPSERVGEVDAG